MPNWCYTCHRMKGPIEALEQLCNKLNEWTEKEYVGSSFGSMWLGNILAGCLIDTGACTAETVEQEYERREKITRAWHDARMDALIAGKIDQETIPEPDEEDRLPRHRGSLIEEPRIENGMLCVETETAWNDMADVFEWVIEKLGLPVEVYFLAEELGNGAYYTNDVTGDVFGKEYEFYVSGELYGEDTADGTNEYFDEFPQMDRKEVIQLCGELLGRELDCQMSDDELDAVIAEVEAKDWRCKDSYVSIYRLQRGE